MRVLVFGRTGQVGRELARYANVRNVSREEADFTQPDKCVRLVRESAIDLIINTVAYTAVDNAESDREIARIVNAETPAAIAIVAAERRVPFLSLSTDYVFGGDEPGARREDDRVNPVNHYGATKLAGELGILAAGGVSAIVRTSWVFSAHGNNFAKTMLRLGAERDKMSVVCDQTGGPTAAADIAQCLMRLAAILMEEPDKAGIYHYTGAPSTNWAAFAARIFEVAGLPCRVEPVSTEAYPMTARRPRNSTLDCRKISTTCGISQPDWRVALNRVIAELRGTE